jgi:outer membrane protein assembly factor BamB
MRVLAAVSFAFMILLHAAAAENWPEWRGPLRNGVSTEANLPTVLDKDEVAWKTPLAGMGVSSPIIWEDQVFVTSQIGRGKLRPGNHPTLSQGKDAAETALGGASAIGGDESDISFVVESFQRSDGRRIWEYRTAAEGEVAAVHDKNNLASPSAVTDGKMVYALFGTGQLVALSLEGKLVWQRHLGKEHSPFEIGWGHGSSPTLYRDTIILVCFHNPASYLLALDKETGKEKWKVQRDQGLLSYSTPIVVSGPAGDELIVNGTQRLEAYNPANGELLWFAGEANRFPIPVAAADNGVVYATRGYRSGPYMAIRLGGKGDVSSSHVQWLVPTGAPYVSSLTHYEGMLYMAGDTGVLAAADAKTGEKLWQERVSGVYTASPVAGDGKVYFVSESGQTVVVEAGRHPRILARNDLGERVLASPAIAGGQLFIRSDASLFCVGRKSTYRNRQQGPRWAATPGEANRKRG